MLIAEVVLRDLDVVLREPFGIATGSKAVARNVYVGLRLEDGTWGWGEAAPFEAVNGEARAAVRAGLEDVRSLVLGADVRRWRALSRAIAEPLRAVPSARCAVETAMLDALARSRGMSLVTFFGGSALELSCDLTITTGTAHAAEAAARRIAAEGYHVLKLKVGGVSLDEDLARIEAVRRAAPRCVLVLDANAALASVQDALVLAAAAQTGEGGLGLFEQPLAREDLRGASELVERGIPVCADEGARSAEDVARIAGARAATAVNLKITKSGVAEALDMLATAKAHGLEVMMGGMVETSLAMNMSACIAAGVGGVRWIDLDTPLWMIDEPCEGGFRRQGPLLDLREVRLGHGVLPLG